MTLVIHILSWVIARASIWASGTMAMTQKLMISPAKDDNTMESSVFFVTNGKLDRYSA